MGACYTVRTSPRRRDLARYMDTEDAKSESGAGNGHVPITLSWFEFFLRFWHGSNGRVVFLAGLVTLCAAAAFIGAVPTHQYGHDIFTLLENGWRVVSGQRVHVDYVSPWGPVMFLIVGLGLRISGYSVNGVGYGSAIVGLIIGLWSYRLGRNRFESSPRLLASLFLVALVVAPYALGTPPWYSSHAMVYNRYGYALVGLVMLEAFQPAGGEKRRTAERFGGISSGAAVALALFLKASFFLVALAFLGASLLLRRPTRRRLLGLSVGFSLVALALLAYLRFDVLAMLRDLQMAAGARSESLFPLDIVSRAWNSATQFLAVLLLGFAASWLLESAGPRWREFQLPLLAVLVIVADIGLLSTNSQSAGVPLIAVFALILVNRVTARQRELPETEARSARPYYALLLSLGGLLFLPQLASDIYGLAYGAWQKRSPSELDSVLRFTEPRLAPLLLYDDGTPRSNGRTYTTYVNDGVALLRRATSPKETVLTMDMANPFPYALGRPPALGGIAAAAYQYTLSDTHRPSDDRYFGNSDIVMVPKRPSADEMYWVGFYKLYEPALLRRYALAAESDWWYLLRRK